MTEANPTAPEPSRWEVIRDLLVFQLKLGLDALRDVLLAPISLVAGLAGLLLQPERPGRWLQEVFALGRRTERWINLFGSFGRGPGGGAEAPDAGAAVDDWVAAVEEALVEQVERGGITAAAKDRIDRALDGLHARTRRPGGRRLLAAPEPGASEPESHA